ncbi:MAG: hypothetical protein R6V85_02095 [Polyangia bacterium]
MKKITLTAVVALSAALALGCDTSELADLTVYNNSGADVSSLVLEGPEKTGNLVGDATATDEATSDPCVITAEGTIQDGSVCEIDAKLEPGKYTWIVGFGSGTLQSSYESTTQIDLFPGRNTLELTTGGL